MQKNRKLLLVVLGVVLIMLITCSGTLAYLTDTAQVTNTFTVGDVELSLTEPNYKGDPTITPGFVCAKDPTIRAVEGDMYARMKVTLLDGSGAVINNATIANIIWDFIFYDETGARIDVNDHYTESGIADNHVTEHFNSTAFTRDTRDTRRGTNGIRYYNYKGSGDNILYEGKEAELFTYVIIPADISAEDFDLLKSLPGETFKILVEAQAVQTEYLTAADSSDPYGILDDLEAAAGTPG